MMMKAVVLGGALLALAEGMATPAEEGFARDVVGADRRILQGGGAGNDGPRRPNDINICENVGAYENTIPFSQITGTIHDDAVRRWLLRRSAGPGPAGFTVHLHRLGPVDRPASSCSSDNLRDCYLSPSQTDRTDCSQGACSGADTGSNG